MPSQVACDYDIIQARFTARLLNKAWTSQNQAWFSARQLNSKLELEHWNNTLWKKIPVRKFADILFCWIRNWIPVPSSHHANQTEPEWPNGPKTPTRPQNKFVDPVSVFNCIWSTPYDETHRSAADANEICVCYAKDNFNSLRKKLGCVSVQSGRPAGPYLGHILSNFDPLLSIFWIPLLAMSGHAQMENLSIQKLVPRSD